MDDVLEKYINKYTFIQHQYDTYHNFLINSIKTIIEDEPSVTSYQGNEIIFQNIQIQKPLININNQIKRTLYPSEARTQGFTYKLDVFIDVIIDNIKTTILFFSLPCMVNSKFCNLYDKSVDERYDLGEIREDPGGNFIINGKERVIISQGRKTYNKMMCTKNALNEYICEIRSFCKETAKSSNVILKFNRKKTDIILNTDKQNFLISDILKEYGYINEFKKSFGTDNIFLEEIMYFIKETIYSVDENLNKTNIVKTLDITQLFPHLKYKSIKTKIIFLGKMARKLCLTECGILIEDDKSHLAFQRLEPVGILCENLFKMMWKQFIKAIAKDIIKKQKGNILSIINSKKSNFTKTFHTNFSTSSWGVDKNSYKKEGVSEFSQCLNSYLNHCSILKKINKSIGKKDKNIKGRMIEPSCEYYICNYETPEGETVGSKLALTVTASVSIGTPSILVQELIEKYLGNNLFNYQLNDYSENKFLILVNGNIIGNTIYYKESFEKLKDLRDKGIFKKDTSFFLDEFLKNIEIWCDSGRYIRPLFNSKKINLPNWKFATIDDLEELGVLVHRDPLELENSYVATYKHQINNDVDYLEIHPCCMMGIVAAQIIYSNCTQSPRLSYMANMGKQAIGYVPSKDIRTDNTVYSLDYVQKPIVTTKLANILKTNNYPNGINAVVAIGCFEGFNQEDSVILNKGSVDRGLFTMVCYKTITVEIKISGSKEDILCIPEEKYRVNKKYDKIGTDGLPKIGVKIEKGDVIVGKIRKEKKEDNSFSIKDESYTAKLSEYGTICAINIISGYVKITIKQQKIPELGDKFCSGMAQKGTCGMILSEEDMPFSSDGTRPDIIINPHCLPSRMTINQLIGTICSKARCISGDEELEDGTPFTGTDKLYKAMKLLKKYGFKSDGTETLYNGYTGKKFLVQIMIGTTYYHRLPHFAENKEYSVGITVSRNILTGQPNDGRSKEGGLKYGEMEKDVNIAQGAIKSLNEKMVDLSDIILLPVCKICKLYTFITKIKNKDDNSYKFMCSNCKSLNIAIIKTCCATKLSLQLIESLGINIHIQ